jgi:protein TonB
MRCFFISPSSLLLSFGGHVALAGLAMYVGSMHQEPAPVVLHESVMMISELQFHSEAPPESPAPAAVVKRAAAPQKSAIQKPTPAPKAAAVPLTSPKIHSPARVFEKTPIKANRVAAGESSDLSQSVDAAKRFVGDIAHPSEGSSVSGTGTGVVSRGNYETLLASHLMRVRHYPERARRRGLEGDVVLDLVLGRDGFVQEKTVYSSSKFDILDEEAIVMVDRAVPFPAPPQNYRPGERLSFRIPVRFELR